MSVYMVERELGGIAMTDLAAAQKRAIATAAAFTEDGRPVRYLRSTFVPDDGRCMCLFEATSPQDVKDLNERAGIPFTRVVEALDLGP